MVALLGTALQLTVIELTKADQLGWLQGPASDWVRFFEHWQEDSIMTDITHEPVKKAMGRILELSADEEAQRLAFVRERGLRDWNSSIRAAREEGLEEGERRVLQRLLIRRFGELPAWAIQKLEAASAEQLDTWADEILVTQTLDELFGR